MQKVCLGKTGLMVTPISFGGIPIQRGTEADTTAILDKMEQLGMNYIDTARGYTVSESYLGKALSGRRDKFILATKSMSRDYENMKRDIDISLGNLQTDHIDVYQVHNIKVSDFDAVFGENGAYKALEEAKAQGKIGHIGFTAHGLEAVEKLIDEYEDKTETIMFPFNFVEVQGEAALKRAKEKNIGTIAMKPLAGGNLEDWRLALKFVAVSNTCDIAIPGIGSVEECERDFSVMEDLSPLTEEELATIEATRKELGNQFCRRCGYCAPCTVGIDIPSNFTFANYLRNYGLADWAKDRYNSMNVNAKDCIECGVCETRCPYNLPIRDMLKKVAEDFAK